MSGPAGLDRAALARLLMACGAVRFGSFVTKSGRASPYFVNLGEANDGGQIAELGRMYVAASQELLAGARFDCVFGPAYKAIPLAVATAMAAAALLGRQIGYCFDRKEPKPHGEGGLLVSHVPQKGERVLVVDDVITDGASKRAAVELLRRQSGAEVVGMLVAVDRLEPTTTGGEAGGITALAQLEFDLGIPARAMVDIRQLVANAGVGDDVRVAVDDYLSSVGSAVA